LKAKKPLLLKGSIRGSNKIEQNEYAKPYEEWHVKIIVFKITNIHFKTWIRRVVTVIVKKISLIIKKHLVSFKKKKIKFRNIIKIIHLIHIVPKENKRIFRN